MTKEVVKMLETFNYCKGYTHLSFLRKEIKNEKWEKKNEIPWNKGYFNISSSYQVAQTERFFVNRMPHVRLLQGEN